ncbi:Heparinase II III family [Cordyceps militaris]|uniref:Heparinase II III family n=1 Tax=Cordyceps militaris TaxID=73501 RepID=A0A2H4SBR7_CORMI|nr:Heparinase II III family [Cordyceps militaris]
MKASILLWCLGAFTSAAADTLASLASLPDHPRLMLTPSRIKEVASMIRQDSFYRGIICSLKGTADAAVATPFNITDASKWASTTRMQVGAVAGTFLLRNKTVYSEWVKNTILTLSNLPDWNPSNFLVTADIAMTVAIGYDWVYDELTQDQRNTIELAVSNKAFTPALTASPTSWVSHTNNWAQVTRGCLVIAALAVGDKNPALASEIITFSMKQLNISMEQYAPDGAWFEGHSYGAYTGIFLSLMLRSMETALGTDLGLSNLPGISNYGGWLTHGFGQAGGFSWADGSWLFANANTMWSVGYFAQRFNKPEWLQTMVSHFNTAQLASFQAFVFYDSALMTPSLLPTTSRSNQFKNVAGMTHRSSWTDTNGWFFGFMGGFNGRSHGHLDAGSFVIDYKGYRWAQLLGSDSYSLTDYFHAPTRWKYYRCRTEGANTLSISTQKQTALNFANQIPSANNSLRWVGSFDKASRFGVANLTQAYSDVATSVLRGVVLLNDRVLVVRDEVRAQQPVDIATSWHTTANVTINNNQSATLEQGGIALHLAVVSPPGAYLELIDTNPCNAYSPCAEMTNQGIYNLAVRLPSLTTAANISVVLSESGTEATAFDVPLSQWYADCREDCWESENIVDPYWLRNSEIYY